MPLDTNFPSLNHFPLSFFLSLFLSLSLSLSLSLAPPLSLYVCVRNTCALALDTDFDLIDGWWYQPGQLGV